MANRRVGISVVAAAAVLSGILGCSASPEGDSTPTAPNLVKPAPDRNLTLEVGTVIHPDGTIEYRGRNVTLEVGTVIHPDGTVEYRGGTAPVDASTLLEASAGQ